MDMKGNKKKILYTELAKYYDQIIEPYVNTKKEVKFLKKLFDKNNVKNILDVGCGTGRHCIALTELDYSVTGIDISKEMLEIANKKKEGKEMDVSFMRKDISELNFQEKEKFDAVICMWSTFYYLPQPLTINKIHEVLRKNGIFFIEGKDWEMVEKKPKVKKNTIKINKKPREVKNKTKIKIKQKIEDTYKNRKRIRKIYYNINGKELMDSDICEMIPLSELKEMLKERGFKIKIYSDWKLKEYEGKDYHFQLVAHKL